MEKISTLGEKIINTPVETVENCIKFLKIGTSYPQIIVDFPKNISREIFLLWISNKNSQKLENYLYFYWQNFIFPYNYRCIQAIISRSGGVYKWKEHINQIIEKNKRNMDFSHVLKVMYYQKEEEKVVKDLVNKIDHC